MFLLRTGLTLLILSTLTSATLQSWLASSLDECLDASKSIQDCLKVRVADYLGAPRTDQGLLERALELIRTHEFRLQLPEALQGATLVFKPGRGVDFGIEYPDENDVTPRQEGREMMKQKMLFPLLMLLKLKMKALTPILLGLVGLKATKALILSKIAILLVAGFLIVQLCQKLGMAKMSMTPPMPAPLDPTPPPSMYGPPSTSSYEPSGWEPSSGPYSRVFDTAQQLAYSGYTTQANAKYKA